MNVGSWADASFNFEGNRELHVECPADGTEIEGCYVCADYKVVQLSTISGYSAVYTSLDPYLAEGEA